MAKEDKKHVIKATFYMKSGNNFSVNLNKLSTTEGMYGGIKQIEWFGAGGSFNHSQLHHIDPNEIEAIIYSNYEDWTVDDNG